MKTTVTMIALVIAAGLAACGKKEEVKLADPAPVAAPAAPTPTVDATTKQDAQNVPTTLPAKQEEAKK